MPIGSARVVQHNLPAKSILMSSKYQRYRVLTAGNGSRSDVRIARPGALAVFGLKKTMPQPSRGIVQVLN